MSRLLVTLAAVLGLLAIPAATHAAQADRWHSASSPVSITEVDTTGFPTVRMGFGADTSSDDLPQLAFYENGEKIAGVKLFRGPIGSFEDKRRTDIMLALDTSLSMGAGTRLQDAQAAARKLIAHARPGDRVGLATFGGAAKVLVHPTDDHSRVTAALSTVSLSNKTTMFDAVSKSAQAFEGDAARAIVLLSDGTDAGSVESRDEAIGEALKARSPVYAVAIRENEDVRPLDLTALANGSDGELHAVVGSAGLDALFDELGRRILQPYWIEYRSSLPTRSRIELSIAADGSRQIVARETFRGIPVATGGGATVTAPPKARGEAAPMLPIPGGLTGVLVASLPFGILIFLGSWTWLQRRSTPDVLGRVERYTARASTIDVVRAAPQQSLIRRLVAPVVRIGETFLGGSTFFAKTRMRAEQAAIAIKPSELFAAMVVCAGLGFVMGLAAGNILLYIALPVIFGSMPNLWLIWKARSRRVKFEDQLADVLQNIASSLKAGHSFNQALNAMMKDAPSPTSEEFARVQTEARLGMPTEDALQHMADRMGSADFDFAVTTVNIQRTVGGSLADILEMVGDTVRNRQQFRKKVKALTSMGQMSAYVLLAMPVFMAVSITTINYDYMAPLYTTTIGHMMIAAGVFSMILGYLACMKIVRVKV